MTSGLATLFLSIGSASCARNVNSYRSTLSKSSDPVKVTSHVLLSTVNSPASLPPVTTQSSPAFGFRVCVCVCVCVCVV